MAYRSFEDLEVWKRACRLAVRVYEALRECRDWGLRDQMTRAAVSIASNIAEGAERDSILSEVASETHTYGIIPYYYEQDYSKPRGMSWRLQNAWI